MELIDVHLRLVAAKGVMAEAGASVQLLERCLGIIPGHGHQPPEDAPFTANRYSTVLYCIVLYCTVQYRVIIAGFLTDGPAIKLQDKLRVGDWIRSIDGHQVSGDNDNGGKQI